MLVEGFGKTKKRPSPVSMSNTDSADDERDSSAFAKTVWTGRTDTNKRVIFNDDEVLVGMTSQEALLFRGLNGGDGGDSNSPQGSVAKDVRALIGHQVGRSRGRVRKGDYVIIKVLTCTGHTLRGVAVASTTLREAHALGLYMM